MQKAIKLTWILLFFLLFINFSHAIYAQSVDDLIIMTEHLPPFGFEKNGKVQGILVDRMVLLLEAMNLRKARTKITILPWGRAYRDIQEVENTVLFGMVRNEEREKLFKWVGPIASVNAVLIARKDQRIKVNSIDDLKKYEMGAVSADAGLQYLLEMGIKRENIETVPYHKLNLRKLKEGRVDLISAEEISIKWQMIEEGLDPEKYETVYIIEKTQLYTAFHREISDTLINSFQQMLDKIKTQKEYDEILNKYLKK